jgi:hypothetical protein
LLPLLLQQLLLLELRWLRPLPPLRRQQVFERKCCELVLPLLLLLPHFALRALARLHLSCLAGRLTGPLRRPSSALPCQPLLLELGLL